MGEKLNKLTTDLTIIEKLGMAFVGVLVRCNVDWLMVDDQS